MHLRAIPGALHSFLPSFPQSLPRVTSTHQSRLQPPCCPPPPRPGHRRRRPEEGSPHSPPLLADRCAGMAGHTLRNPVLGSQRLQRRAPKSHSRCLPGLLTKSPAKEKRALLLRGKSRHLAILRAPRPAPESRRREIWRNVVFIRTHPGDGELLPRCLSWENGVLPQKLAFN